TQGMIVEPVKLSGLEHALEIWWFFFGPLVAYLFGPTVEGHLDELSPILREYLAIASPESPVTMDQILENCAQRDIVRGEVLRQVQDVPILLSPVSSKPAFRHGEGTYQTGAPECYRQTMRYSQWLNLAGFPGVSVPVASSLQGLPIGVQIIGRPHED